MACQGGANRHSRGHSPSVPRLLLLAAVLRGRARLTAPPQLGHKPGGARYVDKHKEHGLSKDVGLRHGRRPGWQRLGLPPQGKVAAQAAAAAAQAPGSNPCSSLLLLADCL